MKFAVLTLAAPTLVVVLAPLPAQARRGPVVAPTAAELDPRFFDQSRVILKLVEGSAVRLRAGRLAATMESSARWLGTTRKKLSPGRPWSHCATHCSAVTTGLRRSRRCSAGQSPPRH